MRKNFGCSIRRAYFAEVLRSEEHEGRGSIGKFEFIRLNTKLRFLFVLFAIRDLFAQGARMFAIEGPFDRLGEGVRTEIFGQHGGPGDGLEEKPMCANRGKECEKH